MANAPTVPGWGTPAVTSDGADSPTTDDIRAWAEEYVSPQSAKSFAYHVWTEWNAYEPDGTLTVGQFLTDLLAQWRGLPPNDATA